LFGLLGLAPLFILKHTSYPNLAFSGAYLLFLKYFEKYEPMSRDTSHPLPVTRIDYVTQLHQEMLAAIEKNKQKSK